MSEKGLALAEVLVASAITAAVIAGCLSTLAHQTRNARSLDELARQERTIRNAENLLRAGLIPSQVEDELPFIHIEKKQERLLENNPRGLSVLLADGTAYWVTVEGSDNAS